MVFQGPREQILYGKKILSREPHSKSKTTILLWKIWCLNKILESLWVLTLLLSGQVRFSFFKGLSMFKIFIQKSARTYKYHAISHFIDDLCAINDDDDFSEFLKCIYPRELELKLEHSGTYATFLHLDIKIEDGIFV